MKRNGKQVGVRRKRREGQKGKEGKGKEGKGREGKKREGKGREGKGRERGCEDSEPLLNNDNLSTPLSMSLACLCLRWSTKTRPFIYVNNSSNIKPYRVFSRRKDKQRRMGSPEFLLIFSVIFCCSAMPFYGCPCKGPGYTYKTSL